MLVSLRRRRRCEDERLSRRQTGELWFSLSRFLAVAASVRLADARKV
jgi:hypothetical protein